MISKTSKYNHKQPVLLVLCVSYSQQMKVFTSQHVYRLVALDENDLHSLIDGLIDQAVEKDPHSSAAVYVVIQNDAVLFEGERRAKTTA